MSILSSLQGVARDVAETVEDVLAGPRYHYVKPGETLKSISAHYYGTPGYWESLYWDNQHVINDPNRVYPGQRLLVSYFPQHTSRPEYARIVQ